MQLKRIWRSRQPRLVLLRRIVGDSMTPTLKNGQLIIATGIFQKLVPGNVVVFRHNHIEKVKRLKVINKQEIYLEGDNLLESTDSRSFGWLNISQVVGKVIWPRV